MAKPRLLRSVLEETLKSLGVKTTMKGYSLWAPGERLLEILWLRMPTLCHPKPDPLYRGLTPTWIQQLQFLKPTLLEKINGFLKEDFIHDIRFRLGKISSSPPSTAKVSAWEEESLDQNIIEQIDTSSKRSMTQRRERRCAMFWSRERKSSNTGIDQKRVKDSRNRFLNL